MSEFHEQSYQTGKWVGKILGSLMAGSRSMTGTWPEDALESDRKAVESMAQFMGLRAVFDGRNLTIEEPQAPTLRVVK